MTPLVRQAVRKEWADYFRNPTSALPVVFDSTALNALVQGAPGEWWVHFYVQLPNTDRPGFAAKLLLEKGRITGVGEILIEPTSVTLFVRMDERVFSSSEIEVIRSQTQTFLMNNRRKLEAEMIALPLRAQPFSDVLARAVTPGEEGLYEIRRLETFDAQGRRIQGWLGRDRLTFQRLDFSGASKPAAGVEEPPLWAMRKDPERGYQVHVGDGKWIRISFLDLGTFQKILLEALRKPGILTPQMRVLEVGVGEGPILTALAGRVAHADGVEIHAGMARRARENLALNGITNAEVLEGDLTVPVQDRKYQLIVSNPPAVPYSPVMAAMAGDERIRLANDGGLDGRRMIERILRETPALLEPGGAILMIHPQFADLKKTQALSQQLGLRMEILSAYELYLSDEGDARSSFLVFKNTIEGANNIPYVRKHGQWTFKIYVLRFTKPAVPAAAGAEEIGDYFEIVPGKPGGPVALFLFPPGDKVVAEYRKLAGRLYVLKDEREPSSSIEPELLRKLVRRINPDYLAAFVNDRVDAALLSEEVTPNLKGITHMGLGTNNIDLKAAVARGLKVSYVGGGDNPLRKATAEMADALALTAWFDLTRRLEPATQATPPDRLLGPFLRRHLSERPGDWKQTADLMWAQLLRQARKVDAGRQLALEDQFRGAGNGKHLTVRGHQLSGDPKGTGIRTPLGLIGPEPFIERWAGHAKAHEVFQVFYSGNRNAALESRLNSDEFKLTHLSSPDEVAESSAYILKAPDDAEGVVSEATRQDLDRKRGYPWLVDTDRLALKQDLPLSELNALISRPLAGQTIGFLGLGSIGATALQSLAPFAGRLLGVQHDSGKAVYRQLQERSGIQYTDLDTLLKQSRIVVLSLPGAGDAVELVNPERLERLGIEDLLIVNIGRGQAIAKSRAEEARLAGYLRKHPGVRLATDVLAEESFPLDQQPLLASDLRDQVLVTAHIASNAEQPGGPSVREDGMGRVMVRNFEAMLNGQALPNPVPLSVVTAGAEETRFPDPVELDENPFQPFEKDLTFLNRDLFQEQLLKERILPDLIRRNASTRTLTFAFLGISTGEEPARFWYWVREWFRAQGLPVGGEKGWKIRFLLVDKNPVLIDAAKDRFRGEEPDVRFSYHVYSGVKRQDPDIERKVREFSQNVVRTVESDKTLIEQSFEWILGDMADPEVLAKVVPAADLVVSNQASSYIEVPYDLPATTDQSRNFWKTLTASEKTWILTTDIIVTMFRDRRRQVLAFNVEASPMDGSSIRHLQYRLLPPLTPPAAGAEEDPPGFLAYQRALAHQVNRNPRSRFLVNVDRNGMLEGISVHPVQGEDGLEYEPMLTDPFDAIVEDPSEYRLLGAVAAESLLLINVKNGKVVSISGEGTPETHLQPGPAASPEEIQGSVRELLATIGEAQWVDTVELGVSEGSYQGSVAVELDRQKEMVRLVYLRDRVFVEHAYHKGADGELFGRRGNEELRGGLEERLVAVAEGMPGGQVLAVQASEISRRVGLEEFLARAPRGLAKIVVFGKGSSIGPELSARNDIFYIDSDDPADLGAALAGLEEDRVVFLGDRKVGEYLKTALPASMSVAVMAPGSGLEEILLTLGLPADLLGQVNASGLEEQLARDRAA